MAQAQKAAWAQRAGGPGVQEGPGQEKKPRRTGTAGRRKDVRGRASATSNPASARYPRDGVPAPRQPTARVTLVSPRILRQPRHCYHPPLPHPDCPGDGTKGREANAVPKEARFLTSRAARTRHSHDRQEDLQSQDAECCPQQDAGLGTVLPPHIPAPRPASLPGCRGSPGGTSDPLSSPKEHGVRPWSLPSLTETS